jgi:hypothetical protein
MTRKRARADLFAQLTALAAGLAKNPAVQTIFESEPYSAAELGARLQLSVDAEAAVLTKKAELADAIKSARGLRKTELGFVNFIRSLTKFRHTGNATALAEYGMTPPKKNPKRTTEQKLLMKAKNKATREKRGTLGPKKKKAIKGNVTGVVIKPVVRGEE